MRDFNTWVQQSLDARGHAGCRGAVAYRWDHERQVWIDRGVEDLVRSVTDWLDEEGKNYRVAITRDGPSMIEVFGA